MWDTYKKGDKICGKIRKLVKAGYLVRASIKGTVFLPFSQVKVGHFDIGKAEEYVGKDCEFKIVSADAKRKNMVVSLREIEKEEIEARRVEMFKAIEVGDEFEGTVGNILDYGAFVDVDHMVGLIHINELEDKNPRELFQKGQRVQVKVVGKDEEKERISFGLKECC
jgi:small subunit ribosomal protein S1